ncbi:MAG: SDR family oxidoreductase [Deltaproteobacteria bacterium]|nr:SDR family oxidoreductase [Deltaproteobacteria bacterium]
MTTEPRKILVVGPAGYLGRMLVGRFLDRPDVCLRVLVKDPTRIRELAGRIAEVFVGDPLDDEALRRAVRDIEVAYFPIGLLGVDGDVSRRLSEFARRLRDACIQAGVRRIVYLGPPPGLASDASAAGSAVADVGSVLAARPQQIQTLWLRAGFVLGRGSALFDVIVHLVDRFPVLLVPRWMNRPIGWIALADVLSDLVAASEVSVRGDIVADIGPAPASVREMVQATGRALGMKRMTVSVPVSLPRLSAWLMLLATPLSRGLSSQFLSLICSERSDRHALRADESWATARGGSYASLESAVADAVHAHEQDEVSSRWTESLMGVSFEDDGDDLALATFRDVKRTSFGELPASRVFRAVTSIGGERGWFRFNVLWQLRGLLDKLAGGFGTSIGRRAEDELRVGDLVDVWRVIDLQPDHRLLLMAHMNVFGKAWLEFKIEGQTLIQTAYHLPDGVMGRLYWYSMLPFHAFIFRDMIDSIVRRAGEMTELER